MLPRLRHTSLCVYMALKKYATKWVREVKTRHRGQDKPRENPSCRPKLCLYQPIDNRHGGFLFCREELQGEPELVPFEKVYDDKGNLIEPAPWLPLMQSLKNDVESFYDRSTVFWPERRRDWEEFFLYDVPWEGLSSVPPDRLPVFALRGGQGPTQRQRDNDAAALEILANTGHDEEGRMRYLYSHGKDVADYDPVTLRATFGGRLMDGIKFVAQDEQLGECL